MSASGRAIGLVVLSVCASAPAALRGHLTELRQTASRPAVSLGVPDRANAHVSLAASESFVAAAWSATAKGSSDIYLATSRDGGRTFSPPEQVNSTPGEATVNGEQPPRVALVSRTAQPPSIVVVWTAKGPKGTRLLTARSEDGGRTFAKTSVVAGSDAAGNRGWESIAADAQGRVHALWLDHRNHASPQGAGHAGHGPSTTSKGRTDGVAMAQRSELYLAALGDESSARSLTAGVCYCCKTALAAGPDGALYAAWRHVYPGNLRDIAFTVSRDGGRTAAAPIRVSEDKWALDGCPDDGPAMAVDAGRQIHVVWPSLVGADTSTPSIGIFYARSRDGKRFSARERLATLGAAHHPQVALAGTTVVVAWDELVESGRRVVFARGADEQGRLRFTRLPGPDRPRGAYPSLASTPGGVLAAWTTGGDGAQIQIHRIDAN